MRLIHHTSARPRLFFVRINRDATLLRGQSEHDIAGVRRRRCGRNGDGNEDVIVPAEGRYGMRTRAGRQRANYRVGVGVDDAQSGIGCETAGRVEIIVAGVVPDLVGALGIGQSCYLFAIYTIDNHQRLSAAATYQQVL